METTTSNLIVEQSILHQSFYSTLLQHTPDAVFVWELGGRILYWNRGAAILYGYSAEEAQGYVSHELLQTAHPRGVHSLAETLEREGRWEGELPHCTKDGRALIVHSRQVLIRGQGRKLVLEVNHDITKQKRVEQERDALREREQAWRAEMERERDRARRERERTEAILASINDHFVLYDHEWRYVYVNDRAAQVLGRPKEQLLGQCIWDLFPEAVGNLYHRELHRALAEQRDCAFEHYYQPWDRWFENRVYVVSEGLAVYATDITERKQTEERYRRLFTSMQEGFLLAEIIEDEAGVGTDFRYLDVNPAAERMIGLNRDQIVGKTARALIPAVREDLLQMYAKVVRTGEPLRHEVFEPMLNQYHENFAFRPAPGQVAVLFWDITQRKQAEEALKDSERRLRLITDHAPVLISYCGADRIYKFMNKPNAARFGLHPKDVVGKHLAEIMGQAAYARIAPYVDAVLRGEHVEYEVEVPYQGLGTRYVWVAYEPEFDEAGRVIGFVGAILDITERKRIEEALRASEARERARAEELATLMEAVPAVVFIAHDPAATIITGSRTAREVLRMMPSKNLSRTAPEAERPTHFKVFKEGVEVCAEELPIQLAARGVEVRDYEEEVRFEDGTAVNLFGNAVPLQGPDGQPRGSIGAFVDITPLKRLEAALREGDRRKDEFLAMLAHELRNPLAPIRNAVQILRRTDLPAPQLAQMRDVIERQTEHLTRLVDDLLDVSRITQGRITLRQEKVELLDIIGRAVETSRPLIDARQHQLTVVAPAEPVRLEGDFIRLAQVVSNLLNNAAKYTDEGGDIQLTAELKGDEVLLRVKDNGIGIPPEDLSHIFDLFTQTDRSLDRTQGGLGIGLTLVHRLVEMHGGRVAANSAGLGQGSEFMVHLPLAPHTAGKEAAAPAKLAESRMESPPTTCRILVVDDNVDSAESLALLLKLEGHEVQMAHDGPSTIDVALAFRPQVILLDIGLPGMSGYEVARRLHKEPGFEKVVLIALTGYGRTEDRQRAKAAGFAHHLTKPVDYDLLLSLIDSLRLV